MDFMIIQYFSFLICKFSRNQLNGKAKGLIRAREGVKSCHTIRHKKLLSTSVNSKDNDLLDNFKM